MSPTRKKPATNRLCRPMNAPRYGKRLRFSICPFAARCFSFRARALLAFCGFAFCGVFYSAPPRFKTKPILDSASNVLYIFPGALAFYLSSAQEISLPLFGAAWCWAMAMHAYSAVPDITADKSNGLQTVATLLGFRGTLFFCLMLYALAATLSFAHLGALSIALGAVYVGLMLFSLRQPNEATLLRVYRWFPLINSLCGMALFFAACGRKFF